MTRSSNNVFKRGDVWYIRYDEPAGPDGKRKQRMKSCKGMTRQEAERKLRETQSSIDTNCYVAPNKQTLGEFLDLWLNQYASITVAPTTFERYKGLIQQTIKPAIGGILLNNIKPENLQKLYKDLLKTGRKDGTGGLSPRTVLQVHRILHRVFAVAIRWGKLVRNPADGATPPRVESYKSQVLNVEESRALLDAARDTEYMFAPILISLATGMRRGEVLGLKWSEVDLETGVISVIQSLEETTEHGLRLKDTKTSGSTRAIVLPRWAIRELRWWKEQQQLQKALNSLYEDNNLVCARPDGTSIRPDTFSSQFRDFVDTLGIKKIRFHDLRHTQATMLISIKVPVKVVSERLGHSTTQITQNLYTHVLPTMQQEAADKLDEMFGDLPHHD